MDGFFTPEMELDDDPLTTFTRVSPQNPPKTPEIVDVLLVNPESVIETAIVFAKEFRAYNRLPKCT